MEPRESLDHVVRLMEYLPDVSVEHRWCDDANAHLVLRVASLPSLALIVQHALFSNFSVETDFCGPHGLGAEPADPGKLRFAIHPQIHNDGEPPSELEIFGIFMARSLKARQLVSALYANELQKQWNAVVM